MRSKFYLISTTFATRISHYARITKDFTKNLHLRFWRGDCATCHFSIDYKDERHKIMLDCKVCHTPEKLKSQMSTNGCGRDCFECHSVSKINAVEIKEHIALNTCISCHTRIDNKLTPNINPLFNNKLLNRKLSPLK